MREGGWQPLVVVRVLVLVGGELRSFLYRVLVGRVGRLGRLR
jgi:hypothetical protein